MTDYRILLAAGLCGVSGGLWLRLRRRLRIAERARELLGTGADFGGASAAGSAAVSKGGDAQVRFAVGGLPDWLRNRLARARAGRPGWLVPELLLVPMGMALAQATRSPVPLIGAAIGVLPLRRWRQRRRRVVEARLRASAVIDLCEGLAAEMRSGATPEQALFAVTRRSASLRSGLGAGPVARLAAGRYGADIPAALRSVAELPGGRGAAAVAACWQVTAQSGTGLAVGLDRLADALRAERALTEEITGELAAPRATIAVLAALPLVGLLLGAALGAKPVQILLHTPTGLACLASGALLEAAGLMWTTRIVQAAEGTQEGAPEEVPAEVLEGAPDGRRADVTGVGCGISRTRRAGPDASARAEVAW